MNGSGLPRSGEGAWRHRPAAPTPPDRWFVPRLFMTGSAVIAESTVRAWSRSVRLCVDHTTALIRLTVGASSSTSKTPLLQAELRDEVLGLAREIATVGWLEVRRAIDELDTRTRDPEAVTARPTRPYGWKP